MMLISTSGDLSHREIGGEMVKFGIHALSWVSNWDENSLDVIDKAKEIGYDLIEIPLFEPNISLSKKVKERLDSLSIGCTGSVGLPEFANITSSKEEVRNAGLDFLKKCVINTAEMGGDILTGVIYTVFGPNPTRPATEEEWTYSANGLREVARFAQGYNITLGIEAINRYETNLVNTGKQAKRLKEMIGESNVGVHLDTYHMNIEERGFYQPIKEADGDLVHIHMSESDRGIPGTGNVDWDEVFKGLSEIGYSGALTTETFCSPIPGIVAASVWRKLIPDSDIFARETLRFLKKKAEEYKLI